MSDDVTPIVQGQAQTDPLYIRTYAKDLASTGGSAAVPPTAAPIKPVAKAPVAPAPQQQASTPPPPAPVVTPPVPPQAPVPAPDLPPAYIIPKAPSTDESREAVLARLRAKANVPTPEAPAGQIIPNAPSTNEDRQTILDRLHAKSGVQTPKPTPPPPPKPVVPIVPVPPPDTPEAIHTYKSDFAQNTKQTGASPISVLAAEQDAKGAPSRIVLKPEKSNNLPVFLGGGALIVLGIASVFFAFQLMNGRPLIPTEIFVPSLIFADERAEIAGSGFELQQALLELRDAPMQEGSVKVAYITYATTTQKGEVREIATGGTLIAALGLPAPEIVLRNIAEDSMVGVIRAENETRPFFILRVSSYERTFAGMLDWEATMAKDLSYLYPAFSKPVVEEQVSATTTATTTTASSTASVAPGGQKKTPFVFVPRFKDEVIENHDVRILRDEQGDTVLLYGYRDKSTLVIARNETAFKELLTRLSTAKSQ